MNNQRINKIAKKIMMKTAFIPNETSQDNTSAEQELNNITSIEITIDYSGLYVNSSYFSENENDPNKTAKMIISTGSPKWPLKQIKSILQAKTKTTLKIVGRKDGKDNWQNIGLTVEQAKEIILSLTVEQNYVETLTNRSPFVDVYHKDYVLPENTDEIFKQIQGKSTYLYIKIFVQNNSLVISQSFHWGDPT